MITHELKKIFEAYEAAQNKGSKAVLATVVALDGSSYRRPGVRMLILDNGHMVGAVSGGCVEKEVYLQSLPVFQTKVPKVMTYDGRFRLGCEGILYILLEPFEPQPEVVSKFWSIISQRTSFEIISRFERKYGDSERYGTVLKQGDIPFAFRSGYAVDHEVGCFTQTMPPCFQLVLIGAEHDAVQLCSMAALMGWEVTVVTDPKEERTPSDFPGLTHFVHTGAGGLPIEMDGQTAVVLMTHSYVTDLRFLMELENQRPAYFGILGPARRRDELFNELMQQCPDVSLKYLDSIYGPAGLELGAETPQEIALSVLSEILAVINKKSAASLREKPGKIHS